MTKERLPFRQGGVVNSFKSKKQKEQEKPIEEQFVLSARKQHCQEIE